MGSNRQIRRAEERRLRKQNRKATTGTPVSHPTISLELLNQDGDSLLTSLEETIFSAPAPPSLARQQANERNAQLSTGPRTEEGKRRSSRNALKHGLTSQTIILSPADAPRYAAMCDRFRNDWKPVGDRELELTQMLIDTQWRLNRVPRLEAALYAAARLEFPDLHADQVPELQEALLEIHTQQVYERQFRNLHIQESRLRRYYATTAKELTEIQETRRIEDRKRAHAAKLASQQTPYSLNDKDDNGFVFANPIPGLSQSPKTPHLDRNNDGKGVNPTLNR